MTSAFRQWHTRILAILVAVLQSVTLCVAEVRYDDVIYLAEWNQPPLHLKVLYRTPLTSTRDPHSMIAYLTEGQPVEVIGLGESQDYVKTRVATGPAQGWVNADALEAPPAELIAKLRDRREKAEAHRDLIERHEAAVGMTRVEVRASLGKPDRMSHIRVPEGAEEQWFYITYRYLPHYPRRYDANGQLGQVVSYRRAPAGQRVITFRNDEVVEIADQPTEQSPPPSVVTTPPAGVAH